MKNGEQQSPRKGAQDSEPRALAGPALGQGLQEQIEEALQPTMAELRERIAASVRHELDRNGRRREPKVQQDASDQGQAEEESSDRPKARRSNGSPRDDAPPDASARGEDAPPATEGRPSAERGEPRTGDIPDLGQLLQEQIGEALQPAMAEFREEMAATVRRELDQALDQDGERRQPESRQDSGPEQDDEGGSAQRGADQSGDEGRSKASDSGGQRGLQSILPQLGKPLLEALPEILEKQGEHWLRSRLDQAIDVLFSDWVRTLIQQEVKRMLQLLRRVALQIVPDRATRDDLTTRADRVIETLARDGLDQFFADSVRDDLKTHGQQAIHALFELDLKAALRELQAVLRLLLDALLGALRQCWEQVLELLVRVVVAVLQTRLSSVLKDAVGSLATAPGRKAAKEGRDTEPALHEKGSEARERVDEPAERSSSRASGDEDQSHHRGKDDRESRARGSEHGGRQVGRPPTGRPPSGRPPSGRQTSGRSFSDRAPSGRSPRAVSR